MIRSFVSFLCLFLTCPVAYGECSPVIITHPQEKWDTQKTAKTGIEALLKVHQSQCPGKTYILESQVNLSHYPEDSLSYLGKEFLKDVIPFESQDGEHEILITDDKVTLVGGYYGFCQYFTIMDVINMRLKNGIKRDLEIILPLKAIYDTGKTMDVALGTLSFQVYIKAIARNLDHESLENTCFDFIYKDQKISKNFSPCKTRVTVRHQ